MVALSDIHQIEAFSSARDIHLALGCFDGVHLGHQAILRRTMDLARTLGGEPGVLLLEPHPVKVLHNDPDLKILTPREDKIRWIQALGDIHVFVLTFDAAFAGITPEAFARDYLRDLFHVRTAVCGFNYQFGCRGSGNTETLRKLASAYGFSCDVVSPVSLDGVTVSSTGIRNKIKAGDMLEAYALSGHCHVFCGEVVAGHRLGGQIGFPTANIALDRDAVWPAYGVYGAFLRDEEGRVYRSVLNAGVRPTVDQGDALPSFEAFIMDFQGDLYGRTLQAVLTGRTRGEMVFNGLPALQAQIARDADEASLTLDKWEKCMSVKDQKPDAFFSCILKDYPI